MARKKQSGNMAKDFRGWIDEDGHRVRVPEYKTHDDVAERLLHRHYPCWDWESDEDCISDIDGSICYADKALLKKRWVRFVANNIFQVTRLNHKNREQIEKIILRNKLDAMIHADICYGIYQMTLRELLDRDVLSELMWG